MITRRDLRPGLKRRVLEGAWDVMHATALDRSFVRMRGAGGASILMYHSITDGENGPWTDPGYSLDAGLFARQMRFLAAKRRPVSLSGLVEMVERGVTPAAGTVVVTFDDGYLDNLRIAGPILQKYGIPATVFVVSGWVETVAAPWIDLLYTAITRRRGQRTTLQDRSFSLETHSGELEAYRSISRRLLDVTADERERLLDEVRTQLDPDAEPPGLLMNWDEIGQWLKLGEGYEIGLHTRTHTALTLLDETGVAAEIDHGREELARRFGIETPHFSYPYGRADEATARVLRRSGCRSALLTEPMQRITAQSDPFELSRHGAPDSFHRLGFLTGGAYPEMSLKMFGRQ